jgi:RNA polymerase sigma factor (sigma-70 family)
MKKRIHSGKNLFISPPPPPADGFNDLYTQYVQQVYKRCYQLIKDEEQAHDMTQDVFLKVFKSFDRFEGRSNVSTWLYSVSSNHCMDQLRKNKRLVMLTLSESIDCPEPDIDESDETDRPESRLMGILSSLPAQDTQLILEKYQEKLSILELSVRYDLSESAVKMRLKRIRDKIEKQLKYGI